MQVDLHNGCKTVVVWLADDVKAVEAVHAAFLHVLCT